jgi:hypothetical protein
MEMNWEDEGAPMTGDMVPPRMYHFVRVRAAAGAAVETTAGCWAVVSELVSVRRRIRVQEVDREMDVFVRRW